MGYHGELHIIEIWTSLPGRSEHRLLFDWPTVHPSNRSFVTIIIDSCPIFWEIFFLSSQKIIIKGIRILPIKRLLSVYSTVERISIFKNRPNIRIISKNVVHTSTLYKVRRGMRKPIKPAVLYCIWESCFEGSISLWWLFSWRKHLSLRRFLKEMRFNLRL